MGVFAAFRYSPACGQMVILGSSFRRPAELGEVEQQCLRAGRAARAPEPTGQNGAEQKHRLCHLFIAILPPLWCVGTEDVRGAPTWKLASAASASCAT